MIKKTITYTDYNGVERTESHYFNLNKAELMKMELGYKGGYSEMLKRMVEAEDTPAIIETLEAIIKKAYGVKTPDGKGFIKNEQVWNDFVQTEAYSNLFMDLLSDSAEIAKFVNGIIPAELAQKMQESLPSA